MKVVLKKILVAVVVALAVGAIGNAARAWDPACLSICVWKEATGYKTVTCYETRCETYQVCVTKYDHCGNPYNVYQNRTREVQVPVTKQVPYTKYVKVAVN